MKYEKSSLFGMILVIVALLISIYFMCNTNALVPAGYDLAIHGIVISRTVMIAFTLYLVSKLGYFLLNKKINCRVNLFMYYTCLSFNFYSSSRLLNEIRIPAIHSLHNKKAALNRYLK